MKVHLRKLLAYLFPFLLSVILLSYALQKVSIAQIGKLFQEANYFWLSLSMVLGVVSHWARAHRWRLVLKPLGYTVTQWQASVAVFVGYFANFLLPRAGEVARCTVVQRSSGVPIAVSVGTIITERILDILILFVLFAFLLLVEAQSMTSLAWQFLAQKMPALAGYFWLFLVIVVFGVCFGVVLVWHWGRQGQGKFSLRMKRVMAGVWQGIMSLKHLERRAEFVFYSVLIWFLYYLMGYVLFFCFPATAHLDMWFAFIILIIGTIGMSAPVQGGAGAYHLLVGNLFALRHLTAEEGILLATFMHAAQLLVLLVLGGSAFLYSLWAYNASRYPKNL